MKSMNDLREILGEEIDKLRSKQTTSKDVSAIVSATGKILATVKMEIDYAKALGRRPLMNFIQLEEKTEDKPAE